MSNPASFATTASQAANTFTDTQTLATGVKLVAGSNELGGTGLV